MPLPVARTAREAHLYLELHPCACGESSFPFSSSVVEFEDDLASRYTGRCPRCGAEREFVFRLPERAPASGPGEVSYGDATRSELLDPGEWLWAADRFVDGVPADLSALSDDDRRQARHRLASAAAAIDEVLKFVRDEGSTGEAAVPATAFWSERGRAMFAEQPGRFFQDRLEVVRDAYRELAAEPGGRAGRRLPSDG